MASSQISKASYHARSISLPSTSHPVSDQFDECLTRLRSSQSASTSSPSSSLSDRLTGLTELYGCVDDLLQLPSTQQSLSQIQAMLDGSLRLLDICSTSRDLLQQSKERIQDIQSVLRRRCSGELNIASEVAEYLTARKTAKKVVKKCLKQIKATSSEFVQGDVEQITIDIFASLLSYIGGAKSTKTWSAISKLISKSSEKEASASEFDALDATFESIISQKKKTGLNLDNVRNKMANIESEIQELDEVLECLFRHLVKTRATMLNILSN